MRRIAHYYDFCPHRLTTAQLQVYLASLVEPHSWSTVKVDRYGLQLFSDDLEGAPFYSPSARMSWARVLKRAFDIDIVHFRG